MSDSFGGNVQFLLDMQGDNNSTTFFDYSCLPGTWTATNATISTAQYQYGASSGYFNGSNARLDWASGPCPLKLGIGDFTFEAWVRTDSTVGAWARLAETSLYDVTGGWHLSYNGSDSSGSRRMGFQLGLNGGGGSRIDSNAAFPTGQWAHLAIVRYGTTIKMYVDGTAQTATMTYSTDFTATAFRIGATLDAANFFKGYLQDVRFTNGYARYTGNFTRPSALLPHADATSGVMLSGIQRQDLQDGGLYRIAGTASRLGAAGSYRVRLYDRYDGRLIRECWSASNGTFAFDYLAYRANRYFAVAFDHTGTPLNAAISDLLTPVAMP